MNITYDRMKMQNTADKTLITSNIIRSKIHCFQCHEISVSGLTAALVSTFFQGLILTNVYTHAFRSGYCMITLPMYSRQKSYVILLSAHVALKKKKKCYH